MSHYATPGQYLRHLRQRAEMEPLDIALSIDTSTPVSTQVRLHLIVAIEAGLVPLHEEDVAALAAIPWLALDRAEMAALIDHQERIALRIAGAPTMPPATPA